MAIYTTSKCGNCGISFQFMSSSRDSGYGPPLIKCRNCLTLNKTKFKLYDDMGKFKKIRFWISNCGRLIIAGFMLCALGVACLFFQPPDEQSGILVLVGLGSFAYGIYHFVNLYQFILYVKKGTIEKLCEENGGFMWSDAYYN
tara:strand:+ start:144 stop:572 length:429 start_codon:yes stop_codon:yes gene_type:complete